MSKTAGSQSGSTERPMAPADYSVTLSFVDLRDLYDDFAEHLSKDGMFVPIGTPRPPGTQLDFQLTAEREEAKIQGRGEVAWVRPAGGVEPGPAGMAVRFLALEGDSERRIRDLLKLRGGSAHAGFDLEKERPQTGPTAEPAAKKAAGETRAGSPFVEEVGEVETVAAPDPGREVLFRQLEETSASLEETHTALEGATSQLAEAERRIGALEEAAKKSASELVDARKEAQNAAEELASGRKESETLGALIEEAQTETKQQKIELDRLAAELGKARKEVEQRASEREDESAELAKIRDLATRRETERDELAAELEQLREEGRKQESEHHVLVAQLEEARKGAEKWESERDKLVAKLERVGKEEQERESERQKLAERLEETRKEAERAESERESLAAELEEVRKEARQHASEREAVAAQLGEVRAEAERRETESHGLEAELEQVRVELSRQQEDRKDLDAELEEARAVAKAEKSERGRLATELGKEKEGVARFQRLVERIRSEHAALQEDLVDAQASLARLVEKKGALSAKLDFTGEPGEVEAGEDGGEIDSVFSAVYESEIAPKPSLWVRLRYPLLAFAAAAGAVLGALAMKFLG